MTRFYISLKCRLFRQTGKAVRFRVADNIRLNNLMLDIPVETWGKHFSHRFRNRIDPIALKCMR
jgi:hypothetical protein